MPSDVRPGLGWFDRFADRASRFSQAWFFAFCVLLVVVWAPSFLMASSTRHSSELDEDISELRKAVGLEDRESSST
ncbi:hypothetical protein [Jiangella anatolica]|uniref:Uncharacterized protein n=1 Tax=Jiangella anatolica TaxID=2670374 RepID=A0A2W2BXE9_9ACTN|nr:hypothetical protein [Jiangella anatolica]PZF80307.1 hypothetical protein C1I92_26845 [Jiangella anatolica]